MRHLLFASCLFFLASSSLVAQKIRKDLNGNAYIANSSDDPNSREAKARDFAMDRSEAYNRKMDKVVSRQVKKLKKRNPESCDCPGNPNSKRNKANPYKKKRAQQEKEQKKKHRKSKKT
jgi:flagellar biosynthesis GTPase FlhF